MADGKFTFDDLLGTPTPAPMMTPVASPTPLMTPAVSLTPAPVMTPAQPGLLDATGRGISAGISDVTSLPGQIRDLGTNFPTLVSALGTKVYNDPLGSLLSAGRGVGRMAFQGLGGAAGAVGGVTVGAPAGPPGMLVGGVGGLGLGTAAGGFAYDELENEAVRKANQLVTAFGGKPFELPNPETGMQRYEKGVREATSAVTGEALLRPLMGLFKFAKGATKYGKASIQEAMQEQIPFEKPLAGAFPSEIKVSDQQKGVVGDLLVQAGVTPEQLERAAALKKSGLPEYKNLSTADLLGNEKLKVAESAVAESPAGQLPFQQMDRKQLEELNQMVGDLTSFPGSEGFELGQKIRESFVKLKEESKQKIQGLYDFLYQQSEGRQYTTTALAKEISNTTDKLIPAGYARDKSVIDKIIKNLTPKDDVGMPTFRETSTIEGGKKMAGTENLYDVRNLVGVSSRLKTEARALRDKKLGREATMYDQAADVVDKFIQKTGFGKEFEMANSERAKFAQLFEQGNVSNLDVPFAIPAENIAATLGQNTDQWVQSLKVLGKDQDARRALLTQRLKEFDRIGDPAAKIKWLDDNASLFKSTNGVDDIAKAREQLIRVRDALKRREKGQEILKDVDLTGIGIGELQMAGLTGNPSDSRTVRGFLNAAKQTTRDRYRQAIGGTTRVAAGLTSPAVSVGAALAGGAVGTLFNRRMVEAVQDVNQMMVRALSDPEAALDAIKYAGQMTTKRQAREALLGSSAKDFRGAGASIGTGGVAVQKGQALAGAGRAAALNLADALTPGKDETKKGASTFPTRLQAAPVPAPTPAAAQTPSAAAATGAKKFSFDDLLGSAGAVPTPTATPSELKAKAPKAISQKIDATATKYGIDSDLMHAIVDQESKFNPKAVSEMKASGLMQLMPAVAAKLGVDDVFNEDENLEGGAKLLRQLMKRFDNDIELVLAAYNSTPSRISQQMEKLKEKNIAPTWNNMVKYAVGKNPLVQIPEQTLKYVPSVLKKLNQYKS